MYPENNLEPKSRRTMEPVKPRPSAITPLPAPTDPAYTPPPAEPPRKSRFGGFRSVISTVLLFLVAPVIALLIAGFVVQSYQVDGQSMEPTLQDNDRLVVNKWQRSWARITNSNYVPSRGDIVIFNHSGSDFSGGGSKQLIKRVIGLPGERVVVVDGKIIIYNDQNPGGFNPDADGGYSLTTATTPTNTDVVLAEDEIFVCGDNRANSEDSRYFGPIKAEQVVGKLALRIVPLNKAQRF